MRLKAGGTFRNHTTAGWLLEGHLACRAADQRRARAAAGSGEQGPSGVKSGRFASQTGRSSAIPSKHPCEKPRQSPVWFVLHAKFPESVPDHTLGEDPGETGIPEEPLPVKITLR